MQERGGRTSERAPISQFTNLGQDMSSLQAHVLLVLLHPYTYIVLLCLIIFLFLLIFFGYYFIILAVFLVGRTTNARTFPLIRYVRYMYVCMYVLTIYLCVSVCVFFGWNMRPVGRGTRKRSQGCHLPARPQHICTYIMCVCVCVCNDAAAAEKYCSLQLSVWTNRFQK